MTLLSIDPHLRSMAWAVLNVETERVLEAGTELADKNMSQEECQSFWYSWAMNPALVNRTPVGQEAVHLVVEVPDHLKSKSNQQAQSIVSVALAVGALCQGFHHRYRTFEQVEPRAWKGNKSKAATAMEVWAAVGKRARGWSEHECDAAALGLWWCRRTKNSMLQL